jgi:NAD(P)H-flavin reductase
MTKKILLLGRKGIIVENARSQIGDHDLEIYGGTGIDDVRSTFTEAKIDHVFMGAGIELEKRLEIVREVFRLSDSATVHMKDASSGPQGFLPFVRAVLAGLKEAP